MTPEQRAREIVRPLVPGVVMRPYTGATLDKVEQLARLHIMEAVAAERQACAERLNWMEEVERLRRMITALAERCAAQSELLSRDSARATD